MQVKLDLGGKQLEYKIVRHPRAKRLTLSVSRSGTVKVSIPKAASIKQAKSFVANQVNWIKEKLAQVPSQEPVIAPNELSLYRLKARKQIRERLGHFNTHYQFEYYRVSIRDQKTRWGSCSSKKTLSFNLRLVLVPTELLDYVVVHELCHLSEMNHSQKFWDLVAETIPDYPIRRKQLRKYEYMLR